MSVLCLSVKAQTDFNTYANEVGTWNEVEQDWDWGRFTMADIKFIFDDGKCFVNDAANSIYTTYGDPIENDDVSLTYKAYDNNNKLCYISITTVENYDFIIVIYLDELCIRYLIQF